MIRFTIFGIPVEIQPWFWVTTALLGDALHADTQTAILHVLVFMIVAMLSILAHELGHALTGRKLGGGDVMIALYAMGGLAFNRGGRFTRGQRALMILAGPGAGFLIAALTLAVLCLIWTPAGGISLASLLLFGHTPIMPTREVILYLHSKAPSIWLIYNVLWINFWWGVMNLLPILPLDGGRFTELYLKPARRACQLGMITGVTVAIYGLVGLGSLYTAALFGWLAWQNYKQIRGSF
jgi:stage IV sporulation protein FB